MISPGMGDSYPRPPASTPDMDPWDAWTPVHDEPLNPLPDSAVVPQVGTIVFGPLARFGEPFWQGPHRVQSTAAPSTAPVRCSWCGGFHDTFCPQVHEIEYHENGTVKRVVMR